jgi:hypothetical protein
MNSDIQNQIENINRAIAWVKKNRPNEYENKFLELVEERRKLRLIADAAENNPAIAAYGVSQVGKSYLVNSMLQKNGERFMLKANGKSYNFIEEMNPKTKNTEATGVVTRFTSFSNNANFYSEDYPILMRCLSVSDIILILCEGYYNDVRDYTTSSETEISSLSEALYEKYKNLPSNPLSPIQPDDVLTIQAYFVQHINNAQVFLHTSFFKAISLVADRIPSNDWLEVFSTLWNKNPYQTKLFTKLTSTLAKFNYAKYVYLTPDALLHNGINENTVMSVQCLNQLFSESPEYFTDVYLRNGETYTKLQHLTKSEVCAVCAEVMVKVDTEYLDNEGEYYYESMGSDVSNELKKFRKSLTDGKVDRAVLKSNDILDFPGSRSRTKETLETLSSGLLLTNVYLRGKVAFLFNMYNESRKINILLYCHHGEKNEVADIPILLKNWIMNNVGETMEKRRKTIESTANISPLFYIGTKFNIDMELSTEDIANSDNALRERWNARFNKVLYKECFNVEGNMDAEKRKIFMNWTRPDEYFKNSYILRDFKYSGPLASKLYDNENTSSARMTISEDYYRRMRNTYIENDNVRMFFADPALSWDVCASLNNDGALYIIDNLLKIAKTMQEAREIQFKDVCAQSIKRVYNSIKDYYISDDTTEILKVNIRKANSIFRELEFTCQSQPEYLGHLLKALQLTESESYKRVHHLIPTLTSKVTGDEEIKDYELIRKRCGGFEDCKNEDDIWNKIIECYHFADREEAEEYLINRGVEIQKLIARNHLSRKNSAIITHDLVRLWQSNIQNVQFMSRYSGKGLMDEIIMTNLVACLIDTANAIHLSTHIENEIADYVDVISVSNINEDLVADMVATKISDFVMDFGFSYLKAEAVATSKRVAKDQHLPCFDWIERERKENFAEDEMTSMMDDILSSYDRYTPAYEAQYNKWLEYMYIAFISNIQVPNYDVEANNKLKEILSTIKA